MSTEEQQQSESITRTRWRALFYIPFLWAVLAIVGGFVVASAYAEHGSIIFLWYAFCIGAASAVAHLALFLWSSFRQASEFKQVAGLWSLALAFAQAYFLATWNEVSSSPYPTAREFWIMLLSIALPLLPAVAIANRVVRRVAAA